MYVQTDAHSYNDIGHVPIQILIVLDKTYCFNQNLCVFIHCDWLIYMLIFIQTESHGCDMQDQWISQSHRLTRLVTSLHDFSQYNIDLYWAEYGFLVPCPLLLTVIVSVSSHLPLMMCESCCMPSRHLCTIAERTALRLGNILMNI